MNEGKGSSRPDWVYSARFFAFLVGLVPAGYALSFGSQKLVEQNFTDTQVRALVLVTIVCNLLAGSGFAFTSAKRDSTPTDCLIAILLATGFTALDFCVVFVGCSCDAIGHIH